MMPDVGCRTHLEFLICEIERVKCEIIKSHIRRPIFFLFNILYGNQKNSACSNSQEIIPLQNSVKSIILLTFSLLYI
jgi:hypothetical protein